MFCFLFYILLYTIHAVSQYPHRRLDFWFLLAIPFAPNNLPSIFARLHNSREKFEVTTLECSNFAAVEKTSCYLFLCAQHMELKSVVKQGACHGLESIEFLLFTFIYAVFFHR